MAYISTVIGKVDVVHLEEKNFIIDRSRKIRIWLPLGYEEHPDKIYKVIYMFDGQNLFDEKTASYHKEWQIDESITRMQINDGIEPSIVVGLDCSEDRGSEYLPLFSQVPINDRAYRGHITLKFLVEKVIPYVEKNYRVGKTRETRTIGGSSMGGMMALYSAIEYPELFANILAFSSSFAIFRYGTRFGEDDSLKLGTGDESAFNYVVKRLSEETNVNQFKIALACGGIERERRYIKYIKGLKQGLIKNGWDASNILAMRDFSYMHCEDQWSHFFPYAYRFFQGEDIKDM